MCYKMSVAFSFILLLFANYYVQGENSTDLYAISTAATVINAETSSSIVILCTGGHIDPPNCTKCASNYENQDGKCLEMKSGLKPTRNVGLRISLILLACLFTIFIIISMVIVYSRLNKQRRHGSITNTRDNSDPFNSNTNVNNRFENILRSIGLNNLNKRGRLNFFSRSTNNNSSSIQHQQTTSLRAPLSDNPDEALLFDDPYADGGGFNNSTANPYKSLTLAVT